MAAFVIFLGSFISFALEPMIGRALLPVFGGAPTVWVTCLAAFQLLMVAGYGYAGLVGGSLANPARLRLHLGLLLLAALSCAVVAFKKGAILASLSAATGVPALDVLLCVLAISALAFVLLSANATLVQSLSGGNYRLYAVSNLGSLLGLFCYPILIEPFVALTTQWLLLAAAIAAYAVFLFALSVRGVKDARRETKDTEDARRKTEDSQHSVLRTSHLALLYLLLPAISAALLNATTAHLTLDIAPIPLLWALLLGVFLLSYIVGFSGWSRPVYWVFPAAVSVAVSVSMFIGEDTNVFWGRMVCYSLTLFFVSTFLHSWLYAIRPESSMLSRYYLMNVVGGAAGGLLTSIVAPLVFSSVLEFPILLALAVAALLLWAFLSAGWIMRVAVVLVLGGAFLLQFGPKASANEKLLYRARGFFGTMHVIEADRHNPDGSVTPTHGFSHGNTTHGIQVRDGRLERMPTTYYSPFGCGHAIAGHPSYSSGKPMRVCLVGMGMGVSFVYARTNDCYRAYEISPEVAAIARDKSLFSFVDDCRATPDIRIVDARKGLEAERDAGEEPYDVILFYAFTGDNIPYHLSTREAVQLYLDRLKPDGILCVHFSNHYLDLRPYIKGLAKEFRLSYLAWESVNDYQRFAFLADVAVFLREKATIKGLNTGSGMCSKLDMTNIKPVDPFPTDEKGSFLPFLTLFN